MKTINELEQEAKQARDEMREVMLDEFGIRATLSDRILSLMIRAVQSNIAHAEQLRNCKLIRIDEAKTHTFTVPIDTTRRDYLYSNGEIRVVPLDSIEESLQEVSQEERDSDGWIEWDGGDRPIIGEIEATLVGGLVIKGLAQHMNWLNIISYRILKDEWINWSGGDCPVDSDALTIVKFRDGNQADEPHKAGSYEWRRDIVERSWDIVAYKVAK